MKGEVFHVASDALLLEQHLELSPLEEGRLAPGQCQAAGQEAQGQAGARLPPHHGQLCTFTAAQPPLSPLRTPCQVTALPLPHSRHSTCWGADSNGKDTSLNQLQHRQ